MAWTVQKRAKIAIEFVEFLNVSNGVISLIIEFPNVSTGVICLNIEFLNVANGVISQIIEKTNFSADWLKQPARYEKQFLRVVHKGFEWFMPPKKDFLDILSV